MSEPPGRFGPVVLAGLGAAGLGAVAGGKDWYAAAVDLKALPGVDPDTRADMPLALALSLVVLAAWGVVLVSRTTGRRIVLLLAALGSAGVLACVVVAPSSLPDRIREDLPAGSEDVAIDPTSWLVVAAVAALLGVLAAVAGWVLAPRWPSMGAKYDAPGTASSAGSAAVTDETDLWKALDAGVDPTEADPGPARGPDAP